MDIKMTAIHTMAIICICLFLTAGNEIRLKAQTSATTPPILDTGIFTMEKLQRFRVSYPSDWNITSDNDSISIIKAPNDKAMLTISVTNLSSKTNITLNQYSEKEIKDIDSLAKDKRINIRILESIPYLLSGNAGHKIVYLDGTQSIESSTANAVHDNYYKTVVAWTIAGDRIYKILCSTDESRYPMYTNVFTDIMNSFELLQ